MAKALSISILFLITQLNAQEGFGCAIKTCPIPGQVRMNLVVNAQFQYLSGCNCVSLSTPQIQTHPPQPQTYPPQPQVYPPQPQIRPPQPPPQIQTQPIGTPITVICDGTGQSETLCECPADHIGECKIVCEGTEDACKNVLIKCNNNGYACIIDCMAPNACSSRTTINGPTDGSLTVNCLGEKSCETNTVFNARSCTDLTVVCNGITSCKDAVFHFGIGMGKVECNGDPDACLNARFNLLTGQRGFQCLGSKCPPDAPQSFDIPPPTWSPTPRPTYPPTNRPTPRPTNPPTPRPTNQPTRPTLSPTNPTFSPTRFPTLSPTPAPTVTPTICTASGDCECPRYNSGCVIECTGASDACKDGLIKCNTPYGFPCVVECITMDSCSGSTTIVGPVGASLTVNCRGSKSCEGGFVIEADEATNTQFICRGNEACKGGSVMFYLGTGINSVICSGQPDSCKGAEFVLPYNGAVAFSCVGTNCPAQPENFGAGNFGNVIQPIQPMPIQTIPTIRPTQPVQTHCCVTSTPGDKAWRGKCWGATTTVECRQANTRKCEWDTNSCLPNPPINTFGKVCKYNGDGCVDAMDCCSEVCISASQTCS